MGAILVSPIRAQDLDTNLLANPGFENGLAGWTWTGADVGNYDAAGLPSAQVSAAVGGGSALAMDLSSGGLRQSVPINDLPADVNLHVGGFFGGYKDVGDTTTLSVKFSGTGPDTIVALPKVDAVARNNETVLLRRESILPIPAGTTSVEVVVDFVRGSYFGPHAATADELFAKLVATSIIPDAHLANSELVVNGNFENGYSDTSPLVLSSTQGWEGVGAASFRAWTYSASELSAAGVPPNLAQQVSGEAHLLSSASSSSLSATTIALRQRIDLRGNLAAGQFQQPGSTFLRVGADLGGTRTKNDQARLRVRFLNEALITIAEDSSTGPVSAINRNAESVLLRKERVLEIPTLASYVDLIVEMTPQCCYGFPLADNVSASLVGMPSGQAYPNGKNVVVNGSFEDGSLPGSPLTLGVAGGWTGTGGSLVDGHPLSRVVGYATDPELTVELAELAAGKNLKGQLLRAAAPGATLSQTLDLNGISESIDQGLYAGNATAWLGGIGSWEDTALLRVQFLRENDVAVGPAVVLEPVTASERGGTTLLLKRQKKFDVPALARKLEVSVVFSGTGVFFLGHRALVDGIAVSLSRKSVKACDSKRLNAAGSLFKNAMKWRAKALRDPKIDTVILEAKLAQFVSKFNKSFENAGSAALGSGLACSATESAESIAASIIDSTSEMAAAIVSGLDPLDPTDVALRSKIMTLSGSLGKAYLAAEAKLIKKPAFDVSAKKAKALSKFYKKAAKATESSASMGPGYDGISTEDLGESVGALIDIVVLATK